MGVAARARYGAADTFRACGIGESVHVVESHRGLRRSDQLSAVPLALAAVVLPDDSQRRHPGGGSTVSLRGFVPFSRSCPLSTSLPAPLQQAPALQTLHPA